MIVDGGFKGVVTCCLSAIIRGGSKDVVHGCEMLEMIQDLAKVLGALHIHVFVILPSLCPSVQGVLHQCVNNKLTENRNDETNIVSWDGPC